MGIFARPASKKKIQFLLHLCIVAVASTLLQACGSGGGGSESNAPNSDPGDNAFRVSAIADIDFTENQVSDSAVIGTVVGVTAFASDEDANNNTVTYALTDNAGGLFEVDTSSGVVTVASPLDFSIASSHTISVEASSSDGSVSQAAFDIAVLPRNDFDISAIADSDTDSNEVVESATIGSTVGLTVLATDDDTLFSSVTYGLDDDAGGLFTIDSITGVVTVAAPLDFETASQHNIIVVATSEDTSTSLAEFTISVLDSAVPVVAIRFPTDNSSTNADTLIISGSIELSGTNTVNTFVAELGATSTSIAVEPDNTWQYSAALTADSLNNITFTLTDSDGSIGTHAIIVDQFQTGLPPVSESLGSSQGLVFDSVSNIIYVVDETLPGVYAVNLTNGTSAIFSSSTQGTGTDFDADLEGGIALDSANNRLLVTDDGNDAVIAVELGTGNRSTLASGGSLATPFGITVDAANNRALVVDTTLDGVLAVDLSSGVQTIISDPSTGTGVVPTSPRDIALDTVNNRALVVGTGLDALVSVDLTTGNRMVISDAVTGTGTVFSSIRGVTFDGLNNRVLVAEAGAGFEGIIAVDLVTGNRTELSGQTVGTTIDLGADFDSTRGVIIDSADSRLVVVDDAITSLVAVDPVTGNRTLIVPFAPATPSVGSGPMLGNPSGIVLDTIANLLYIADDTLDATLEINLSTGNRTIISDSSSPGVQPTAPRGLGYDIDGGRLLIPDNTLDAVVAIDLLTGTGSVVSDDDSIDDTSETFASPRGDVAIENTSFGLVVDTSRDSLFRFDLFTGERTTVAEAGDAELEGIQTVVVDTDNNRALVTVASSNPASATLDGVIAINLLDGSLTTLATLPTAVPAVGSGTDLDNPRGLALDSTNDRALVLDAELDALVAVGLTTLVRSIVSDASTGNGDLLASSSNNTNAIVLDENNQRVFVVTEDAGQVVLIDLVSGDQVVISK